MRCTLVGVISACVRIVENETKAEAFAGIYGKFGVDMIFTIGLVSAIIIRNVGKWRQRVCEVQLVGLPYYVAVWLCEYELIRERPVYDNAVFPCRIVVAGGVVLSVQSGVECGVGVQMRNCVGYGGSYVTELRSMVHTYSPVGISLLLVVSLLCLLKFLFWLLSICVGPSLFVWSNI